jgi:hypothetical protein
LGSKTVLLEVLEAAILGGCVLALFTMFIVYSVVGGLNAKAAKAERRRQSGPSVLLPPAALLLLPDGPQGEERDMTNVKWPSDWMTWVGLLGLVLAAAYMEFYGDNHALALALLSNAAGILGIGSQATTAKVAAVEASKSARYAANDTMAIRNDASMPGSRVPAAEMAMRMEPPKV